MKFSIIIPACNAEDRIQKALDSIVMQTFKDYELIVVCDSCKDATADIAKQYGAKIVEVNYHNVGKTRNAGLDIAQGEYILFMDDDDWWLHEFVLQQINDKLTDEDVLCFSFIFKHWKYADPHGNGGERWVAVWNKCWRREFIGDFRFSATVPGEDADFHWGVMAKNPKVTDWDMPLYYYNYMRKGSISWRVQHG